MFKIVNFYIHFSLFFSNVFFLFTETNIIGKINNLFVFSTPFICEFLLFVISIWYIIICCFSNMKWWDSHIIFRLFFWIKKFFLFLFFINLYSIINYSIIETGLFFGNNLINDFITVVIKSFLMLILFFCVTKWFTFIFINYKNWKSINEFALIFLSSSFFLCVLPSINDLFLVVYLIIAMSICIYGLILLNVPIISSSAETGAKYFLLSVISVGLMYGGIKEIYIYIGSLNFTIINNNIFEHLINCSSYKELFSIKFGLIFIVLGFFFKLSAAPNHFWAPEVYAGLPYELLMFIIIPVKFIISFIFLRIIKVVFFIFAVNKNINLILLNEIEFFIYLSVLLSMIIGAVNAVFEHNLRKFIAYSSINQIGFLLIGLLGFNSDIFGFESFFYFLFIYVLNLLLFFCTLLDFHKLFIFLYTYTQFFMNFLLNIKILPLKSLIIL